jgi:hypothetical protein
MAFTQTQLDALEAAIASGTLEVRLGDKLVRYQTINEMVVARNIIKNQLSLQSTTGQTSRASFASFTKD